MFFVLLSGTAHVTLPAYPEVDGLRIEEGINQVIVATDVLGIGHQTAYPGDKPTVALQIPFRDGLVPDHKVLHQGPCGSAIERSIVAKVEVWNPHAFMSLLINTNVMLHSYQSTDFDYH